MADLARTQVATLMLLQAAGRRGLKMTRTSVAKLLYLADLRAVGETGGTGSGVEWRWRHYGPFDNDLLSVERQLVEAESIDRYHGSNFFGSSEYRLVARLVSDSGATSDWFLAYIDEVLDEFGHCSPSTLRDMTYQTAPMIEAQENDDREGLLDLDERPSVPSFSRVAARLAAARRRLLNDDDDTPVDNARIADELSAFEPGRRRANAELLR